MRNFRVMLEAEQGETTRTMKKKDLGMVLGELRK
jgi:hypothetical protein